MGFRPTSLLLIPSSSSSYEGNKLEGQVMVGQGQAKARPTTENPHGANSEADARSHSASPTLISRRVPSVPSAAQWGLLSCGALG